MGLRKLELIRAYPSTMTATNLARMAAYVISVLALTAGASQDDIESVRQAFAQGNYALAFQEAQRLAQKGEPEAELDLGLLYDIGHGVSQDFAQAAQWYRRAAEHGNVTAMFNLGAMYDAGRGVAVDRLEAARWYERAAAQGFGRAQYDLALMLEHGDGVRRNLARAEQLYRLAGANGIQAAERRLTVIANLETPTSTRSLHSDVTHDEAFARAQAVILQRGLSEGSKEDVAALADAAANGSALAAYDLGYCYEVGIGVKVDKTQAYVWYVRAEKALLAPKAKSAASEAARQLSTELTQPELEKARAMLREPFH